MIFYIVEFEFCVFYYLNVICLLVDIFVDGYLDCSFVCFENMLCILFNVVVSFDDKGKFCCEFFFLKSSNNLVNFIVDLYFYFY